MPFKILSFITTFTIPHVRACNKHASSTVNCTWAHFWSSITPHAIEKEKNVKLRNYSFLQFHDRKKSVLALLYCTNNKVTTRYTMCNYNDESPPRVSLKTAVVQLNPTSFSSLPDSLPDLVCISSDCDACPFCPDVCLNSECRGCSKKPKILTEKGTPVNNEATMESSGTPLAFRLFNRNQKVGHNDTYITRCELKRHNTMDSAWLLCGDVVYDATRYIKGHPGGEKSILRKSGGVVDCSKDMKFHSDRAINLWKKNRVGLLRPCPGKDGLCPDVTNEENCVIS